MLLSRDDLPREQLIGALELGFADVEPHLRHLEVRFGLIVAVLHVSRVDVREQLSGLYLVADIDVQPQNLARRLRLDLDLADRLHRAGGLRADQESGPHDLDRLDGRGRFGSLTALASASRDEEEAENSEPSDQLRHTVAPARSLRKSCSMRPSFRYTCRFEYSAMSCPCVTKTIVCPCALSSASCRTLLTRAEAR